MEEAKFKCMLTDKELIDKCNEWVHILAESGGKRWSLQVPVNFNEDPDMLFTELANRYNTLLIEYKEIKRKLDYILKQELG